MSTQDLGKFFHRARAVLSPYTSATASNGHMTSDFVQSLSPGVSLCRYCSSEAPLIHGFLLAGPLFPSALFTTTQTSANRFQIHCLRCKYTNCESLMKRHVQTRAHRVATTRPSVLPLPRVEPAERVAGQPAMNWSPLASPASSQAESGHLGGFDAGLFDVGPDNWPADGKLTPPVPPAPEANWMPPLPRFGPSGEEVCFGRADGLEGVSLEGVLGAEGFETDDEDDVDAAAELAEDIASHGAHITLDLYDPIEPAATLEEPAELLDGGDTSGGEEEDE